jgi:hypothetical protein
MRGFILIAAVSLGLASPAPAENWRASSGGQGATAYIDTDSIQRSGDEVRFWREVRWPAPRAFEDGTRYDRIGALYVADCRAMTLRAIRMRAALGATILAEGDTEEPTQNAGPGTTAETDLRSACFNDWPAAR